MKYGTGVVFVTCIRLCTAFLVLHSNLNFRLKRNWITPLCWPIWDYHMGFDYMYLLIYQLESSTVSLKALDLGLLWLLNPYWDFWKFNWPSLMRPNSLKLASLALNISAVFILTCVWLVLSKVILFTNYNNHVLIYKWW